MPTDFPGAVDSFTNPTEHDALDSNTVPHHEQHANLNDAVTAIEELFFTPGSTGNAIILATGRLMLKWKIADGGDDLYYEVLLRTYGGIKTIGLGDTGEAL